MAIFYTEAKAECIHTNTPPSFYDPSDHSYQFITEADCENHVNYFCPHEFPDGEPPGCVPYEEAERRSQSSAATEQPSASPAPPQAPPPPSDSAENRAPHEGQECEVVDPSGTSTNVRTSPNGARTGRALSNGSTVRVVATDTDIKGRIWINIGTGWVFGELLSCHDPSNQAKRDNTQFCTFFTLIDGNRYFNNRCDQDRWINYEITAGSTCSIGAQGRVFVSGGTKIRMAGLNNCAIEWREEDAN